MKGFADSFGNPLLPSPSDSVTTRRKPSRFAWVAISNRHQREGYRHSGALGIGLLPAYRGRGVGARLALSAIDAARLNGIERIELEVWASNAKAITLYRQLGFVEEGVRRRARFLDGHYDDSVEMALLDAPLVR